MKGKLLHRAAWVGVAVVLLFFMGPRTPIQIESGQIDLPSDLDDFIAATEAGYDDLRPGTEKKIVWHNGNANQRTPLAIVYLHGFSASRQEVAPLCARLAERLGANVFYTRFRGHGRSGRAMTQVSVAAFANDASEALAIGSRLGQRVIVIGTSTGGTMATWLATRDTDKSIAAVVLLSPNFGPRNKAAEILNWPWARYYVPLIMGKTRRWTPTNPMHARFWTTEYPVRALFGMMGCVRMARSLDLESITLPFLLIYAPKDQVVDAKKTDQIYRRLGSQKKQRILLETSGDPSQHVIAGDILSPQTTDTVLQAILKFIKKV